MRVLRACFVHFVSMNEDNLSSGTKHAIALSFTVFFLISQVCTRGVTLSYVSQTPVFKTLQYVVIMTQ